MSDAEFFTIEDEAGTAVPAEFPNYEAAFSHAGKVASDTVGPLLIVWWTRTETTRLQREITVKSEDMTKASSDARPL